MVAKTLRIAASSSFSLSHTGRNSRLKRSPSGSSSNLGCRKSATASVLTGRRASGLVAAGRGSWFSVLMQRRSQVKKTRYCR
jgi:hypothetical protein